ncbi:MAG: type II toxin-antitoxin system VapC family toxin [Sandarakinorhabdus sp.]|nr:type II toxin-antitoxin system VapC family toxin [Sandarakinorhabdus sp.]
MTYVLDASAVLAVLFNEAGRDIVIDLGQGGTISAVNLAEVLTRSADKDVPVEVRRAIVGDMGLNVVAFDANAAELAAELRAPTRRLGLSLADRACLALARTRGLTALTGDRAWADLDIGVEIMLIR